MTPNTHSSDESGLHFEDKYSIRENSEAPLPHEVAIFKTKVRTLLNKIGFDTSEIDSIQNEEERESLYQFLGERLIDRGFRDPLPFPKGQEDLEVEFPNTLYSEIRGPLPILTSSSLSLLKNQGYQYVKTLDIGGLYNAGQVPLLPNGIAGDYLLRDVIQVVYDEITKGQDQNKDIWQKIMDSGFLIVRTGGDEFAIMSKRNQTIDDLELTYAVSSRVSGLYNINGDIVLRNSSIKFTDDTPGNTGEFNEYKGEEVNSRIDRLMALHPTFESIIKTASNINDLQKQSELLALLETLLYDSLLQKEANRLSHELQKDIFIYKDRQEFINVLEHLSPNGIIKRIDVPGILKKVNDEGSYELGGEFITFMFNQISRVAGKFQNDIRIYRRGGDFYLVIENAEDSDVMDTDLKEAFGTTYQVGKEKIPFILSTADVQMDFKTHQDIPNRYQRQAENDHLFSIAQDEFDTKLWKEHKKNIYNLFKDTHDLGMWQFLANSFISPFEIKRGVNRLKKLGFSDQDIADLKDQFYLEESKNVFEVKKVYIKDYKDLTLQFTEDQIQRMWPDLFQSRIEKYYVLNITQFNNFRDYLLRKLQSNVQTETLRRKR
jgi:hypothetical protein